MFNFEVKTIYKYLQCIFDIWVKYIYELVIVFSEVTLDSLEQYSCVSLTTIGDDESQSKSKINNYPHQQLSCVRDT
jgi:hypothetical protein